MSDFPAPMTEPAAAAAATEPAASHARLEPDPPDPRDLDIAHAPRLGKLFRRVEATGVQRLRSAPAVPMLAPLPSSVSLKEHCGPVRNQGDLNSCTAHAAVALIEAVEARLNRRTVAGSPMFLYKASRNFLRWTGDKGAYLRTAAGSLTLFGVLPEDYWPYDPNLLDTEPSAFCYQLAQRFRATSYFRIDSEGVSAQETVDRMKALLSKGVPSMLGYTVYFGAEFQAQASGGVPLPLPTDIKMGGHALMVCGYDDKRVVQNTSTNGATSHGAFLVQNSRGTGWGEGGFGWLPYDYFLQGLVNDVWSVINTAWIDLESFEENPAPAPAAAQG